MNDEKRLPVTGTLSTITVYQAYEDLDKNSGRGARRTIGYFTVRQHALNAAVKKGIWGANGDVEMKTFDVVTYTNPGTGLELIRILGNQIEFTNEDIAEVKERALAKLSTQEKKALGLVQ